MKIVKNYIVLTLLAILSFTIKAHEIDSIEISVVLHANGDASITEIRSAEMDEQGTEGFIKIHHLDNTMKVKNFSVSDEHSGNFMFLKQWDSNQGDRLFKKGKCGINETSDGYELCWGIGEIGPHHYKIGYTVTNLVQSFTDCDGFNHNFYQAENTAAKEALVTIVKENGHFSKEDVQTMTYSGFDGSINLIDGKIIAKSKSFDDGDEMIIKCRFNKNVFHPAVKHDTSHKNFFLKRNSITIFLILFSLFAFLLGIIPILIKKNRHKRHCKRWFGVSSPDSPKMSTEIPFNGDLQMFFGYLNAIDDKHASVESKVEAFIVRMINNGDIELLDGDNKVKIINPPASELPSSIKNSYDNVYHCLLNILWANSNEDNVVYIDMVKVNPFENYKFNYLSEDRANYKKFEEYYNIISDYPAIKPSTITPEEAISVMGLKKYLQETSIDYENSPTTNGIPSTEYLVYETLFGIKKHSGLNFVDVAHCFAQVWQVFRLARESDSGTGGSGGSTGGGGSGFR